MNEFEIRRKTQHIKDYNIELGVHIGNMEKPLDPTKGKYFNNVLDLNPSRVYLFIKKTLSFSNQCLIWDLHLIVFHSN